MKKLLLALLLACGTIAVFAQSATNGNSFFVYRNNGTVNAFLREDVDSIVYSNYDDSGFYHDNLYMQRVYTKDSIYQIPLASIDSVSLKKPETIINKDVYRLTASHVPYIIVGDTVSFTMKLDTPDDMRPRTGNIAVADYNCSSFPDGIIARIIGIDKKADGYHYVCEQASLDDVIDQIMVFEQVGYEEETTEAKGQVQRIDKSFSKILWDKHWEKTIPYSGTTTTLGAGDKATMTITISKTWNTPLYFGVEVTNKINTTIDFKAESTASISPAPVQFGPTITAGKIPMPAPLSFIWIEPKLSLFGYFEEQGKVELNYGGHFTRSDNMKFAYTKGSWTFSHSGSNDASTDVSKLSMEGSAEVGIMPKIFFSFNGTKMGFGVNGKVGLKEYINFTFDATKMKDESFYGAMKDSYSRTTIPYSMTLYGNANLFAKYDAHNTEEGKAVIKRTFAAEKQWGENRYILPLFHNMNYDEDNDLVSYSTYRKLLLPVEVGLQVTDADEAVVLNKTIGYTAREYSGTQSFSVADLDGGKTHYAQPTVCILGYTMPATPKIELKKEVPLCPDGNHPHMIDLGLPSDTKWACCNVGASSPEEYGLYFAWGETQGYTGDTSDGRSFNWASYKWMNSGQSSWNQINKYTIADRQPSACWYSDGTFVGDGLTELLPEDDAATANWGGDWRMPSVDQMDELINSEYTTTEWRRLNGVTGRKITSKINGNSIFLPAAGYRGGTSLYYAGLGGFYWSRSLLDLSDYAYNLYFFPGSIDNYYYRYFGQSVRPVRAQN